MKVLVTGGAGFIGSNLLNILLEDNANEIICVDNFDNSYTIAQRKNIDPFLNSEKFSLLEGDILNKSIFRKIRGVDVIVHLAAKTGVRSSIANPALYQKVNLEGTRNVLDFARYAKVKQFVFTSSSSIYGVNPNLPWEEDEVPMPISPYASSKLDCEKLGRLYSNLYGIRFIALRLFNVFGPAQRPDLVMHKFFQAIINEQPLRVFGNGSSSRNYTYVDDILSGIMAAIRYDRSDYEIVNLGGQERVKLRDLITVIEDICRKKAIIEYYPEQQGDVEITHASIRKAREKLNYFPVKNLKEGLLLFYKWYIENNQSNRGYIADHISTY